MSAILEVVGLEKAFGGVIAAQDINVSVEPGEIIGIIGANGAGKTTFVNMITGYLTPSAGSIRFEGRDITGRPPREVTRLGIGRSFQVSQVFTTMSVEDNLLTALAIAESRGLSLLRPIADAGRRERCAEILARYGITDYRRQLAANLPQGVRKLLDIAMAVVGGPRILLLDEPTSGISVEEKFPLMDRVMDALKAEDVTVLFIEHDMEIVERYVSRVLAFYQGVVICDAPTAQAMVDTKVREFVIGEDIGEDIGSSGSGTGAAGGAPPC